MKFNKFEKFLYKYIRMFVEKVISICKGDENKATWVIRAILLSTVLASIFLLDFLDTTAIAILTIIAAEFKTSWVIRDKK